VTGDLIIAAYILGALITAYVVARVEGDTFLIFIPVVMWPVFVLFAPFYLLAKLGEKHSGR
jgi:hypothetical protein